MHPEEELKVQTSELLAKTFAVAFTAGTSYLKVLYKYCPTTPEEREDASDCSIGPYTPAGVLQLTKLSDIQRDTEQTEAPMDVFSDVSAYPKCFPVTVNNAAPVEGELCWQNAVIFKRRSSENTRVEAFVTTEAKDTEMPDRT